MQRRIELISFLRGFSIFTIVAMHLLMSCHFTNWLGKAILLGGAGVHVFFLCSGFGLYLSHLRKPLTYPSFLRKRFLKVYIPYAILVLLAALWSLCKTGHFPLIETSSHLFLWKMFSVKYDTSLCYPYWFISTIIQFYLAWPLLTRLMRRKFGLPAALIISISWSTVVGILGYEDFRPWGSFFLQYLWEFCLGMFLAQKLFYWSQEGHQDLPIWINVKKWPWWWLLVGICVGMGLNGLMSYIGGILKLYNDIPSLLGYMSCAIMLYKFGIPVISRFILWIDSFSYELYLVHSLVFSLVFFYTRDILSVHAALPICLIAAFTFANIYSRILLFLKLK